MADYSTGMTSLAVLDDSIVDIYDSQFLIASHSIGVMDQLATSKYDLNASSITMSKYALLDNASPLTDKAEVDSTPMVDSKITLTPVPYGMSVQLTDIVDIATAGKATRAAVEIVGINQGRTINQLYMNAVEASSNVIFANGRATAGTVLATDILTPTLLHKLYNKMDRAGVVKIDGMYVLVLHPDVLMDLKASSAAGSFQDITKYSRPDLVLTGQIGELAGFKLLSDNQTSIVEDGASGAVDLYSVTAMGANAFGSAWAQNPELVMGPAGDKLNRFYNVGYKFNMQAKILNSDAVWVGKCASSIGDNA